MSKYEVCVYTFDWETIESFNTLEEARTYIEKLHETQKLDFAIFYNDQLIDEYKA